MNTKQFYSVKTAVLPGLFFNALVLLLWLYAGNKDGVTMTAVSAVFSPGVLLMFFILASRAGGSEYTEQKGLMYHLFGRWLMGRFTDMAAAMLAWAPVVVLSGMFSQSGVGILNVLLFGCNAVFMLLAVGRDMAREKRTAHA